MKPRKGSRTRTPAGSLCAAELALRKHALETFGSPEKMNHWLNRPNHLFQGRTPLQMMTSDPAAVEIELTRIDHGVYV